MRGLAIILSLLAVGSLALPLENSELANKWHAFKTAHSKNYKDAKTEELRFNLWLENHKFIEAHNQRYESGEETYFLRENHLSDLTDDESRSLLGFKAVERPMRKAANTFKSNKNAKIPPSMDWRTKGAVTEIKDQESCGTCWTFSTTAALEGQYAIKYGKLVAFSEMELFNCMPGVSCESGGLMDTAFQWLETHGLMTEGDWPYVAEDEKCQYNASKAVLKGVKDFQDLPYGDENALTKAIAEVGPISVAIFADLKTFKQYGGGVYNDPDCNNRGLDHGVALVGYGSEQGKDYYILRNSWGTVWGTDGYMKLARNNGDQCGVAKAASYPIIR